MAIIQAQSYALTPFSGLRGGKSTYREYTQRLFWIVCVRAIVGIVTRHRVYTPVKPMLFIARSGSEEEGIDGLIQETVAKGDTPQAVDLKRMPIVPFDLADKFSCGQIVSVDSPVAEIGDE